MLARTVSARLPVTAIGVVRGIALADEGGTEARIGPGLELGSRSNIASGAQSHEREIEQLEEDGIVRELSLAAADHA